MSNKRKELVRRFRSDFPFYAKQCLFIKTKDQRTAPLELNTAQQYLHDKIEEQKRKTGKVRILVLKGRQQGISTYVEGRFYAKASLHRNTNVYILTHEQKATDNLFDMVERYHEHNPVAPHVGVSNAKELQFDRLDSSYVVATAGQKAGGRSRMSTLFHGSEVAFWANAGDHFAAAVQTIPDMEGTEVILESTANGPMGEFYERWQEAEAGESDYWPIFIPWFWQSEYRREVGPDFKLSEEAEEGQMSEVEYAELFEISNEQMAWRRAKIQELRSQDLFDQEYPATAEMAFVNADVNSFIKALDVLRARKRNIEGYGPLIMGVDPAGSGGDRFSIAMRRGHECTFIDHRNKLDAVHGAAWVRTLFVEYDPARIFIDQGGVGAGVVDILRNDKSIPAGVVVGVNFAGTSQSKMGRPNRPGPKNRRAEMWQRMKDWLEDDDEPVRIPDKDALQADIIGPQVKPTLTNDLLLESKEEMRRRKVRSPDLADALALTFASLSRIEKYSERKKAAARFNEIEKPAETPYRSVPPGPNGWMA